MALLFAWSEIDPDPWIVAIHARLPGLEVRVWPACGAAAEIEYALVWDDIAGELARFANLRIIFSLGAGVEHLLENPDLPRKVPLVRMVDPGLTAGMVEFVLMRVLHDHRRMAEYAAQQAARRWRPLAQKRPAERRVGVMGLGRLGGAAARALAGLGFDVAGWSRTPKSLDRIAAFHGAAGLTPFLNRTDILVCLLPLTPETENIMDARLFAALPAGAFVINLARGRHLVESDLIAALDSGHIAGATLDVFRTEPLPPEHPFWSHPRVTVVPHIAAQTLPETAVETVTENIARLRRGAALIHEVDRERGY